jgi:hypothetical protein
LAASSTLSDQDNGYLSTYFVGFDHGQFCRPEANYILAWVQLSNPFHSSIPPNRSQKAIIYDVRLRPTDISSKTGTKDLQSVKIDLRILHQPLAEELPKIHQLLGRDYEKKVFNSIGHEVVRTVVAQCTLVLYN